MKYYIPLKGKLICIGLNVLSILATLLFMLGLIHSILKPAYDFFTVDSSDVKQIGNMVDAVNESQNEEVRAFIDSINSGEISGPYVEVYKDYYLDICEDADLYNELVTALENYTNNEEVDTANVITPTESSAIDTFIINHAYDEDCWYYSSDYVVDFVTTTLMDYFPDATSIDQSALYDVYPLNIWHFNKVSDNVLVLEELVDYTPSEDGITPTEVSALVTCTYNPEDASITIEYSLNEE